MGTVAIAPEGGECGASEVEVGRGVPAGQKPTGVGSRVPERPTMCSCADEGDFLEDGATPVCWFILENKSKNKDSCAVLSWRRGSHVSLLPCGKIRAQSQLLSISPQENSAEEPLPHRHGDCRLSMRPVS